jgi:formylglycine-generating enzyme required for sulfatase activity
VDDASSTASIRANDDSTGTSKVGIYLPNNWGIYDIHGNVHNLCLDRYAEIYAGDMESVQTDPIGAASSSTTYFVARGGCWGYYDSHRIAGNAAKCRLATRRPVLDDTDKAVSYRHFGYRLCLEIG